MKLLSFDLETHLIQPGLLSPPIVCGSRAFREGVGEGSLFSKLLTKDDVHELFAANTLEKLLDGSEVIVCGANIAYDFGCVLAEWPEFFPLIWNLYERECVMDVQIAASLNAIAEGRMHDGDLYRRDGSKTKGRYSLDECVREWLGRTDAKGHDRWRLSYALLEDIPFSEWPWDAKQYPVDDAVNTLLVAEAQLGLTPGIVGAQNLQDLARQCHAAFCLHLGSMWGLRTDPVAVEAMTKNVDSHIGELRTWALSKGLMKPKTKKPGAELSVDTKAVKELVFKAYDGLPPPTDGGGISYSRETLEESGDPVLEKFAEVGKWQKFRTYTPMLEEASRGPLNVKMNPIVATGRASSEGLIMLMPRKGGIRDCFVARPGRYFSSVDYAAIEMSTLAQVSYWALGFSDLMGAINADADPHGVLGAELLNITYEEFMARKKANDPVVKGIRQAAKAGNFGFPGMMGAAKFVYAKRKEKDENDVPLRPCEWFFRDGKCGEKTEMHDIDGKSLKFCVRCVEQSQVIRDSFLARWREIRPYWAWVMQELSANDDRITQFVSQRVRGGLHGPAGANTLFQGLAADGAKRALVGLGREMYLRGEALEASLLGSPNEEATVAALREKFGSAMESPLYGSRLCVFAHDETILEIPESVAHEAAFRQAEVMVSEMRTVVPDVKVKAEPALMRRWYKQAEAVFENGKLVPWEPPVVA